MKIILLMMAQTCMETTTTTRMTNQNVQISVRFAVKEKYPNKVMVWVAICNRGLSKPLFRPLQSEAVDSDIYINECLEQRLFPFICEHHPDSNYIVWPDLDGCHYSRQTIAWMDENVNFVPKRLIHQMSSRHIRLRTFGSAGTNSLRGRLGG